MTVESALDAGVAALLSHTPQLEAFSLDLGQHTTAHADVLTATLAAQALPQPAAVGAGAGVANGVAADGLAADVAEDDTADAAWPQPSPTHVTDASLGLLGSRCPQLKELSLAGTLATDTSLQHVVRF